MENWLTSIMSEYGYLGILLLIALENIFPPIPSEIILTFGGFMTKSANLNVFGVVLSATAGSVLGALVLYLLGRQLDVERMEKIIDRWGHILRLTKEDIHKADAWFDRYGPWTVFFCRFIPLVRSLISIPAGMSNMNMGIFLVLTTLGTLIWNLVLVNLGAYFGESWDDIAHYMDVYSKFIYIILFILIIAVLILYVIKRIKK